MEVEHKDCWGCANVKKWIDGPKGIGLFRVTEPMIKYETSDMTHKQDETRLCGSEFWLVKRAPDWPEVFGGLLVVEEDSILVIAGCEWNHCGWGGSYPLCRQSKKEFIGKIRRRAVNKIQKIKTSNHGEQTERTTRNQSRRTTTNDRQCITNVINIEAERTVVNLKFRTKVICIKQKERETTKDWRARGSAHRAFTSK